MAPGETSTDWIRLDPTLTASAFTNAFNTHGRLHVPGFLASGVAERIHAGLSAEPTWERVFISSGRVVTSPVVEWEALATPQGDNLKESIGALAREGFQFLYDRRNLTEAAEAGRPLSADSSALLDFLNSSTFLEFARELTGDRRIASADAQASRYCPGHFLTEHSDDQPGVDRLYAYVLNLTPAWRVDWGGLLAFIDEDDHVAEAYTPKFNALNIFRVPQRHCVTIVAPFAGALRYSITGWLKA